MADMQPSVKLLGMHSKVSTHPTHPPNNPKKKKKRNFARGGNPGQVKAPTKQSTQTALELSCSFELTAALGLCPGKDCHHECWVC